MPVRKLSQFGDGSYGVRLPKDELELDGLLDDGDPVEDDQQMVIERIDEGAWAVRAVQAESPLAD